jgi:hypothetical protein
MVPITIMIAEAGILRIIIQAAIPALAVTVPIMIIMIGIITDSKIFAPS